MTPITQYPLVEHVLVPAPMELIRPGCMSCAGCRYSGRFGCEYDEGTSPETSMDPMCAPDDAPYLIWAVVPAGFSDTEAGHE